MTGHPPWSVPRCICPSMLCQRISNELYCWDTIRPMADWPAPTSIRDGCAKETIKPDALPCLPPVDSTYEDGEPLLPTPSLRYFQRPARAGTCPPSLGCAARPGCRRCWRRPTCSVRRTRVNRQSRRCPVPGSRGAGPTMPAVQPLWSALDTRLPRLLPPAVRPGRGVSGSRE